MADDLLHFSDNYVIDPARRELRRGAELVPVEPQVFDILVFLIANRDRVVSKDDLFGSVWGGRIVSESALASRINAVRSAVGDNGENQRLIRTFPRKGFRFVGAVTERPSGEVAAAERSSKDSSAAAAGIPAALTPAIRDNAAASPVQQTAGRTKATWTLAAAGAACLALAVFMILFPPSWIQPRANTTSATQVQRFDASLIPIISDETRKSLANYPNQPDAKALAISVGSYGIAFGTGDTESAKQEALERCRLSSPRYPYSCRIYSVGMDVVFNKMLLPLPDPEDLRTEPLDSRLNPTDIPSSNEQSQGVLKAYVEATGPRALSITGRFSGFTSMGPTRSDAIRGALERCGYANQRACLVLSVDGYLTMQIPRSRAISDIFLPRTTTELPAADRRRIGALYQGKDWRAVARGKGGWYPVADAPSEAAAVDAALTACSNNDTECRLFAIGNFRIDKFALNDCDSPPPGSGA